MAKRKKKTKKRTTPTVARSAGGTSLKPMKKPRKPGRRPAPRATQAVKLKYVNAVASWNKWLAHEAKVNALLKKAKAKR